jgi:hypothetical protein
MYAILLMIYGAAFAACIGVGMAMQPMMETQEAIRQAREEITAQQLETGDYPSTEEGEQIVSQHKDGWQNPLRYTLEDGEYEIRSAGPDGQFDTDDDVTDDTVPDVEFEEFELDPQFDGEMIEEETPPDGAQTEPPAESDLPDAPATEGATESPPSN